MKLIYRQGTILDLAEMKDLAVKSWSQFQQQLTEENWAKLYSTLTDINTFTDLLNLANCIVCCDNDKIIGMAFLVPSGNPTVIYDQAWSYIRFITVDPDFAGRGIGRKLTTTCTDLARQSGESVIALHTSELMNNARHIYESLGFKIVREIDQRLGKRFWLYKLDLIS
ncbi:GNAT family N-acetyltransferase [Dyadobacter sp. CY356]|uniref:GNAT family N-acetyltransferase n=1 Tax=Dyadobacter sp. CY356 TaxID=2906442 RepID=UPI001F273939|nr:GNAT family N-acetyltransferase [Dyadobacter sp. CY356]MCF0057558.1 GNAT family N-acetyltransferase [Dyadobacter sp. CY356]